MNSPHVHEYGYQLLAISWPAIETPSLFPFERKETPAISSLPFREDDAMSLLKSLRVYYGFGVQLPQLWGPKFYFSRAIETSGEGNSVLGVPRSLFMGIFRGGYGREA